MPVPSLDRLLAFAVVSLVFVAIPGPSVLFTISRALTLGLRLALLTVAGNAAGVYVHVIAVALGVGMIVERSIGVFTALKLAGAAYLGLPRHSGHPAPPIVGRRCWPLASTARSRSAYAYGRGARHRSPGSRSRRSRAIRRL